MEHEIHGIYTTIIIYHTINYYCIEAIKIRPPNIKYVCNIPKWVDEDCSYLCIVQLNLLFDMINFSCSPFFLLQSYGRYCCLKWHIDVVIYSGNTKKSQRYKEYFHLFFERWKTFQFWWKLPFVIRLTNANTYGTVSWIID